MRPAELWKTLPVERREALADAFWRETGDQDAQFQHMEAIVALARRLNFRPKSVATLPIERRAKHLARLADVSDTVATRALIAYHMAAKRPLMAAFLDALGIAHDNGVISQEEVPKPDPAKLAAAVRTIRDAFPAEDVELYLTTLELVDGETWAGVHGMLASSR